MIAGKRILSVSELTGYVRELFDSDEQLRDVWVRGEISNFKHHSSGHMYFTLKDELTSVRCVMFKSRNGLLRFTPENGLAVILRGYVTVYARDGLYQLYVEEMHPDGLGALHLAFEQLKARLRAEGLFEEAHKKKLPLLPRKVGVVTSPTGAAIHDIISVIRRRLPNAHIVFAPVAVQGDEAPGQIAAAIHSLNRVEGVDVLIVGRGGGSWEELWAFNDERVARAIYLSRVPVVAAVGHETDFTIADLVASARAPTPSAAAQMVVPEKLEMQRYLSSCRTKLLYIVKRRLEFERNRLDVLRRRSVLARPKDFIYQEKQAVDELWRRLVAAGKGALDSARARTCAVFGKLDALSPFGVLRRGYSICRRLPDKTVVKSVRDARVGDRVQVLLVDGSLACAVEGAEEGT